MTLFRSTILLICCALDGAVTLALMGYAGRLQAPQASLHDFLMLCVLGLMAAGIALFFVATVRN